MIVKLLYGLSRLILSLTALGLLAGLLVIYCYVFWQYIGEFSMTLVAAVLLLLGRLLVVFRPSAPPVRWSACLLAILISILSCSCAWLYFGDYLTRPWPSAPYWRTHPLLDAVLPAPHSAWPAAFHSQWPSIGILDSENAAERHAAVFAAHALRNPTLQLRFVHAPVDLLRIRLWRSFGISPNREWLTGELALILALCLELGSSAALRLGLQPWMLRLQAEHDYRRMLNRKRLETALTLRSDRIETAELQRHIRDERTRLEREIRRAAGLDD